jgi:hypothetical protein
MEEQKNMIFINGMHEYDYEKTSNGLITTHSLYYANAEVWNSEIRGTLAATIKDDGDGYELTGNAKPSKKGEIDYHYAQQLELLLRLADLENTNKFEIVQCKRVEF